MSTESNGESVSIFDGDEAGVLLTPSESQGGGEAATDEKLLSISSVHSSASSLGNSTDEDAALIQDDDKLDEREALLRTDEELDDTDVELLDSGDSGGVMFSAEKQEDVARTRAISRLIGFSLVLILVPLGAMYFSYRFIFTDHFHLPRDKAVLYGGLVAAALVYVILGIFAWIAYRDERQNAEAAAIVASTDELTKQEAIETEKVEEVGTKKDN